MAKLAAVGAYTHSAGRYWVLRVLREEPFVLRALARRYPHVLVDEAQDIGPEHQAILELLIGAGSQVSLIGDPHQESTSSPAQMVRFSETMPPETASRPTA